MTTYPLSKAAVEAIALRLRREHDPDPWLDTARQDQHWMENAAELLRAALAAWQPTEKQVSAADDLLSMSYGGEVNNWEECIRAAVLTEEVAEEKNP